MKEDWEKFESENLKSIKNEDWKKAIGIKHEKGQTNSALAERDYSIDCHCRKLIIQVKGYFIWWCSSHHQPYAWCLLDRSKLATNKNVD